MSSSNPATIKAIETRYAGCRFRSRLEARWAVFFDTLGVPWEYEPEGFVVEGTPYLPDFRLWGRRWAEIKGDPAGLDIRLLKRFAFEANTNIIILGPIPPVTMRVPSWVNLMGWPELMEQSQFMEEGCHPLTWDRAVMVSREAFADDGGLRQAYFNYKIKDVKDWLTPVDDVDEWTYPYPRPQVADAYTTARSARFEHGERG